MHLTKKNILLLNILSIFFCTVTLRCADFVTITAPADGSTVSGLPLAISGTSSQANFRVRLTLNTTEIGSATTDGGGNWNFTLQDLYNGNYTITADLITSEFEILATDFNSFTVNSEIITITSPGEGEIIFLNPSIAIGTASLASTTVRLSIDSIPVATTTTDVSGNWEASYLVASNGAHALLAELMVLGNPVASTTVNIIAQVPIIFPIGKSQIRIIADIVPTSGSGSGPGYTYTVSGSVITISFVTAFPSLPVIVATGQNSSGSSTVTVSSVSTTATSIAFTAGTQTIHFIAAILV